MLTMMTNNYYLPTLTLYFFMSSRDMLTMMTNNALLLFVYLFLVQYAAFNSNISAVVMRDIEIANYVNGVSTYYSLYICPHSAACTCIGSSM